MQANRGLNKLCYNMDIDPNNLEAVYRGGYYAYKYNVPNSNQTLYFVGLSKSKSAFWACDVNENYAYREVCARKR